MLAHLIHTVYMTIICDPQARQMAGVPIVKGKRQDCIGVLCVVSSSREDSIASCRHGLTLATRFLQLFLHKGGCARGTFY